MSELKKNLSPDFTSHRFNKLRAAHQTELAEDYVEMIYELINEKGEARSVDLAERFGVSNPTVNASIQRLQKDVDKIIEDTKDISKVEQKAKLEGRQMTLIIQPN